MEHSVTLKALSLEPKQITKENTMQSRTPEGKHTKRFIILVAGPDKRYFRSGNDGLRGFFATKEEAQAALEPSKGLASTGLTYKVRQK